MSIFSCFIFFTSGLEGGRFSDRFGFFGVNPKIKCQQKLVSPSLSPRVSPKTKYFQPRNRRVLIRFGEDLIDFFGVFLGVFGFSVFSPDDRIDPNPPPDVVPPEDDPLDDSKNDFDFVFIGLLFVTC